MTNYKFITEESDLNQICNLYKMSGWWEETCSAELISKLVSGSFCFLTAWDEDKLVGMGRVISDSFSDAYIQDVFVDENYRKQGIAANIVSRLVDRCHENNIHWIALIATPGNAGIYEKAGFRKMSDHTPMQFQE